MSRIISGNVYENDVLFKKTLIKTLSSLKLQSDHVLFVNLSYAEKQENSTFYSGIEYVINSRGIEKNNTPVLLYGFESIESLNKKRVAAILNSPAVGYIQMPFKLVALVKLIKKVASQKTTEKTLDKETAHNLALDRISGIKHDLRNAIILLNQHLQGLKDHDDKRKLEKWNTLAKSFSNDFISKRALRYSKVKDVVECPFSKNKSLYRVPGIFKKAEGGYKALKAMIEPDNCSLKRLPAIIKKGESVVALIREIETILEKAQHVE